MKKIAEPSGRDLIVLGMLTAAAEAGEPCPTNEAIIARTGWASPSNVSASLERLAAADLISSEIVHRQRIITIAATGKSTTRARSIDPDKGLGWHADVDVAPAPDWPLDAPPFEDDPRAMRDRGGIMPRKPDHVSGTSCALADI